MVNRRFTMYAGRVICRTQQKAPGPSKEHDDRGEVDHEECLKHTKKATHPERETKADDMMSTTFTHTQHVKDRVNNVKSTVVVPSEARH